MSDDGEILCSIIRTHLFKSYVIPKAAHINVAKLWRLKFILFLESWKGSTALPYSCNLKQRN